MLIWLVGGVALASIAFLIPGEQLEFWPSINAGGVGVAVYLLGLVAYTVRSPFSKRTQIITWITVVIIGSALAVHWTGMDSTTHWQREELGKISAMIHRGIILANVPDSLLLLLREYHRQAGTKKEALAQLFRKTYPNAVVGTNIHKPEHDHDSLMVFVTALSDSVIELTAQEMFVRGRDRTFRNYNGRTGMVQEVFALTEKGIRHESRN